jgi:predicted O-linked N-acetylglucosamine transferase (SPINDLY family)
MMQEYTEIDIALDPLPYNGGTTTLQAMWMGVPVVTLMGQHFVSRMGASFMTAAGLPDWVAASDSDYVRIAVSKASDRAALAALKQNLRATLESRAAWDIQRFTRNFQNHLAEIWCNHVQAMPPSV